MKHQSNRKTFRHAASPRLSRGAVVAAAFLAVAATGGILSAQTPSQADPPVPSPMSMADAGRDNGSRASRSQARGVAALAAAPPTQAPVASGQQAPAAPRQQAPAAPRQQAPTAPAQTPPSPPSSKVLTYQFQLQPNYYYCGPAATRIAVTASGRMLSQDELARKLGTDGGGTDSAHDTTRALNEVVGGNVYQTREIRGPGATPAEMDQLQADVVRAISNGRALVTNIAGSATDTAGGWHSYGGGHYVSIVGYEDSGRRVKIADPANGNGDGTYWVTTINMANWMATRGYSY